MLNNMTEFLIRFGTCVLLAVAVLTWLAMNDPKAV